VTRPPGRLPRRAPRPRPRPPDARATGRAVAATVEVGGPPGSVEAGVPTPAFTAIGTPANATVAGPVARWCSVQGGHGVIAAPPAVGPRGRGDTRGPVMPVGVARGARGGGSATLWCLQGAGRRAGATVRRCDAGRVVVEAVVPALDLADARRRWSRPTRRPSASVTPAVEWIEAVAPTVGLPEQPRPSLGGGGIVADWGRARGRRGRQRLPGSRWPRRVGVTTARRARSRGGSLAPVCTSSGWSSRARAGASASGRAGPSGRAGRSAPRW
jgi:hypothetical protein